jgi:hypothetical protein
MSGPRRAPTWARPEGVFESLIVCGPSIFSTNWSHQNIFGMFQAGNDAEPAQTGQPHLTEDMDSILDIFRRGDY